MIFVTVGSMFPFDRLIEAVDAMAGKKLIPSTVVAQIGSGRYEPKNIEFFRFMSKPEFERRIVDSTMLLGHAGAGTIALAQAHSKPLLVVPRLKQHNEHVNDHQVATARRFEELGHVLVAYQLQDIPRKLNELEHFLPRSRNVNAVNLAHRIADFLRTIDR